MYYYNGNVGIGTSTPAQKLSVVGTIESTTGGIKFPDATIQTSAASAASDTRFKLGAFTRDQALAAGTQVITGVGFQPKAIIFFTYGHDTGGNPTGEASWGYSTPTNAYATFNNSSAIKGNISATAAAIYMTEGAGVDTTGQVQSFDADGFTISWTKTGSPTGTSWVSYMAFR